MCERRNCFALLLMSEYVNPMITKSAMGALGDHVVERRQFLLHRIAGTLVTGAGREARSKLG